jgi:hypothetical protein
MKYLFTNPLCLFKKAAYEVHLTLLVSMKLLRASWLKESKVGSSTSLLLDLRRVYAIWKFHIGTLKSMSK